MRDRAPSQLSVKDVSKTYGVRTVLDQVSFSVRPGERIGVIGENGSGKSTLLRLLAGIERPDTGDITVDFAGGVGHLSQTLALAPSRTVQDAVDASLADLRALERRIRRAEAALADATPGQLDAYGDLLAAYEERGGYEADARVDASLHGLGADRLARDRTLGSLSGGERSRLALACALASGAELLLLDEPTNHLDLDAVRWLQERLRAHRGTVLAVTHDRVFLEEVATALLEVDRDSRAVHRHGDGDGWNGYRAAKAAAHRRRVREYEEWRDELARTEALVEAAGQRLAVTGKDPRQGFGKHRRSSEAKLSGQVRAARVRLEQLRRAPVPAPPEPLRFTARLATGTPTGTPGGTTGGVVAELTDVVVGNRLRLPGLRVEAGQRLLVSGPNGAGKTTLLRVLAGDLRPDTGTVRGTAAVGYLPQELPAAPSREPLLAAYAAGRPGPAEEYADELLALGLFREDDLDVPVASLSAGQQRRLELARLVARPVDLLVLDEPTNHVAPGLVEDLEEALARYEGAVVAVSHDRRFRSGFTGDRLELRAGRTAA
ncbi:ABC-F family ATP-binding cassette domain-containing protein [Streptomyces sp. TRM76323]|uniref:ABC-F family ATP-binding cassette domain-containing protein n=1 Tax=Streptomyces tamarix TaxID=3078565 RepID=A0ABU3QSY8_9ACTN|nr:ABC-F family ATP-binding cassette domain-containing protein [Streptomyces tamarix]MDT9685913.1 ABC-F family ATP-binding cassette domain-containing protein [Streptomyces tamarix]